MSSRKEKKNVENEIKDFFASAFLCVRPHAHFKLIFIQKYVSKRGRKIIFTAQTLVKKLNSRKLLNL